MKKSATPAALLLAITMGCSRGAAPAPSDSAVEEHAAKPRYGAVMAEIGQRFERAGKAMVAGRFELASFEVGELEEAFEGDLPRASLPKEGTTANLPGLAEAFLKTNPPELKQAAEKKDRAAFAAAFERAAEMCNACHKAAGFGFIEIPSVPGKSVPDLDPPAAPATSR